MSFDNVLSNMKDYHLPASLLVFAVGTALQIWHHLDMSYVSFTAVVLGAITGHSFSPAGRPEDGGPSDTK
jgi:hypothetical protein